MLAKVDTSYSRNLFRGYLDESFRTKDGGKISVGREPVLSSHLAAISNVLSDLTCFNYLGMHGSIHFSTKANCGWSYRRVRSFFFSIPGNSAANFEN